MNSLDLLMREKDQMSTAIESRSKYSPKDIEVLMEENSRLKARLANWDKEGYKLK